MIAGRIGIATTIGLGVAQVIGFVLLCSLIVGVGACAHGAAGGYQALANASTGSDSALKAFEAFDHDYQLQIVSDGKKAGKTEAERAADLAAYRVKRTRVNKAFAAFEAVLTTGHILLPLVEDGIKQQTDLTAWLSDLFAASQELDAAIADIKTLSSSAPTAMLLETRSLMVTCAGDGGDCFDADLSAVAAEFDRTFDFGVNIEVIK